MTIEVADPGIPAVADLFTPRQRTIIYLVSVMLAAAYAVVTANVDLHWGISAGYAAWNAGVGVLAVSNTPVTRPEPPEVSYEMAPRPEVNMDPPGPLIDPTTRSPGVEMYDDGWRGGTYL